MRKSPIREWSKEGERYHEEANALILKDVNFQRNLIEQLVNSPPDLRQRMQNIELVALGFMMKDGEIINQQGLPLNKEEENRLKKATDESMLRIHPEIDNK